MRRRAEGLVAMVLTTFAALAGVNPPVGAQENPALQAMEAAAARYRDVHALCATYEQTLSVPLINKETRGAGRLCQTQPNLFAMRFTEPAGDVVVIDGTYVWVYLKSQDPETALRFPMASAPGGFDFHREFLERPAEKYTATLEGTETVAGHETLHIRLEPLKKATYKSAEVWLDTGDHLLRRMRIVEENESVRTVTLSDISLGGKAPDGWFTFTPPPGVRVLAR